MGYQNIEAVLDEAASVVEETWKNAANGVATGPIPAYNGPEFWREKYANSISVATRLNLPSIGLFKRVIIAADPVAIDIEYGRGPWDMKPMLLGGPNVKISKKGYKYNVIPFRQRSFGEGAGVGDHFGEKPMPKDIYEMAKRLGEKEKLRGTEAQYPPRLREITMSLKTGKPLKLGPVQYQHKAGIYEGMMKKGASGHTRYLTMRTVSEKSDPTSWVHHGFRPHGIAQAITNHIGEALREKLAEAAIADMVDIEDLNFNIKFGAFGAYTSFRPNEAWV